MPVSSSSYVILAYNLDERETRRKHHLFAELFTGVFFARSRTQKTPGALLALSWFGVSNQRLHNFTTDFLQGIGHHWSSPFLILVQYFVGVLSVLPIKSSYIHSLHSLNFLNSSLRHPKSKRQPHLAALPPFGPHQPHQKKVWHLWKALRKDIFDVSNSQTCQDFLTQISILFLGPKNQRFCRIFLQIGLPLGPKTLDILMGGTLAGPGTIFSKDRWPFNIYLIKQVSTSHWVYLSYICGQKSLKSRSVITQLCIDCAWPGSGAKDGLAADNWVENSCTDSTWKCEVFFWK